MDGADTREDTGDRVDEFLSHHGVKGMKWGVTKAGKTESGSAVATKRNATGRITSAAPKKTGKKTDTSSDHHKMTDRELKASIARLNMEKQYKELTETSSNKEKAKKFVSDILQDVLKQQSKSALNSVIAKQGPKLAKITVAAIKTARG